VSVDNEEILDGQKDSVKMNNKILKSFMSDPKTLVLKIRPELKFGQIQYNGKMAQSIVAYVCMPYLDKPLCSLEYFQENASLSEKWINTVSGDKQKLEHIDELRKVVIIIINQGKVEICELPDEYGIRLLDYFKLDICHNSDRFEGFDCYAFVSLLVNVKYFLLKPGFDYLDEQAKVGDIVVIARDPDDLPCSIKHWALYLGDDIYLSKIGQSGKGAQSLVEVTRINGMKTLYDCEHVFIARPKREVEPWDGFNPG